MDFSYSDDQKLLLESIEKFLANDYSFESRRTLAESDLGYGEKNWKTFADLGWLMAPFAAEDGGLGGGPVDAMLMMEAFGRHLVLEPYWASVIFAGAFLRQDTNAERRVQLITALGAGELQLAVAFAEPQSRYNLDLVETEAREKSGKYSITGTKSVVINGPSADRFIVVTRTSGAKNDPDGISLFLVDANAKGISRQDYFTVDAGRASEIQFEGVAVSADDAIGEIGKGLPILQQAAAWGILGLGAEASGAMEASYKQTVEYTRERKQFGQPISSFQVLQHRMVDMFIETEQTKSLVLMLALKLQQDTDVQKSASALKAQVGKAGRYIGQQSIQLHGGMGMTDELAIGHYFKRLTVINQTLGDREYHLHNYAMQTAV